MKPFKKHSTPRTRNRVFAAFSAGKSAAAIALDEGIAVSLVYGIKRRFTRQDWGISPPGRGRPSKLTTHDRRRLKEATSNDVFISLSELQNRVAPHVSVDTIRRYLKDVGIMHRKAAQRPFLKDNHAAQRLEFAQKYHQKPLTWFRRVIWSDECSVQRGDGQGQKWVWRPRGGWLRSTISRSTTN